MVNVARTVCVECLIGKQKKPILFKVTEPSSIPYRTPSACAKRAAYPDPPPVIHIPESIAAQAAYQLRYKNTEYYSWVGSDPKCFQVLGLSPSLLRSRLGGEEMLRVLALEDKAKAAEGIAAALVDAARYKKDSYVNDYFPCER